MKPKKLKSKTGKLLRVGECLYRRTTTGVYYFKGQIEGCLFTRSLDTTNRTEASSKLTSLRCQLGGRTSSLATPLALTALCQTYQLTYAHQHPKTRGGKTHVLKCLNLFFHEAFGKDILAGDIRPSDLDAFLAAACKGFAVSSRNAVVWLLKDLFAYAVKDGALTVSPAEHLQALKRDDPERLTPTWEEFLAIVQSVRSQQFNGHGAQDSADFLEAMGTLGLGQAELSNMLRRDVDLERQQIAVLRSKTSKRFVVPIYPQARALVEKVCAGKAHDERVFAIDNAKKALRAACKRMGFPNFSQRSFRRMFITKAIESGVDVKVIAAWQGHRDGGQLVLKTYGHLRNEHSTAMAQRMV